MGLRHKTSRGPAPATVKHCLRFSQVSCRPAKTSSLCSEDVWMKSIHFLWRSVPRQKRQRGIYSEVFINGVRKSAYKYYKY